MLTRNDFVERFGCVFEHSPWIAERAFDHGRIAEQGRHDDLVAKDGLYARLSKLQFAAG